MASLSTAAALYTLVQPAFWVEANQRLGFWSRFVHQTPVKRLRYPNGCVHLVAVRQAILTDLVTIG